MALGVKPHTEPIPGYRLLERLGSGGFGEVWKCAAPDGIPKAIKLVYGDARAVGTNAPQLAVQELQALRRVQSVRHPNLLAIERYDVIDGRLSIVMELADGSLWDRFRNCRRQGRPGIPRDALLRYLSEAAAALDLMNQEHHLQHLDIKPQNLFLVQDHVKVGDFGLVVDLEKMHSAISGAATPVYAAPETFDGTLSRHCDQYSLAIVYQELLTGQRPFAGGSVEQVVRQHLQAAPNLAALPPADRLVVARALSKRPEDRFPSCTAFVEALRDGPAGTVDLGSGTLPAQGSYSSSTWTRPALSDTRTNLPAVEMPIAPSRPERTGDGVLLPAVVIGLGGAGRVVLQRLRQVLAEQFGPPERLPHLRLLYVDTDADAIRAALEGTAGPALAPDEVLPARLQRAAYYSKPRADGRPLTAKWCDPLWLDRLAPHAATQGIRALGRLAFADHFRALAQKVESDLAAVARPDALDRADKHTNLGLRSDRPRVVIAAGLAGGTGSGMANDVAYLARYLLRRLGYAAEVSGWLLLPPAGADPPAAANAYAALTELHHYSQPNTSYRARCDDLGGALDTRDAPFGRLVLLPLDHADLTADGLARELMTPLGRVLDARRSVAGLCEAGSRIPDPGDSKAGSGVPDPGDRGSTDLTCRTFGLTRYAWPRRAISERAGRWLGQRLLERWTSTDAAPLCSALQTWVTEQWTALELGPEPLTRRLQQACAEALGQPVEDTMAAQASENPTTVPDVLARIEELLGRSGDNATPGRLASVLHRATEELTHEWGGRLAQLTVCLIEQPDFRLAGAETAIRLLHKSVERAQAHFGPLSAEWLAKAAHAGNRIRDRLAAADSSRPVGDLTDAVLLYGRWRFQGLLSRQVAAVYAALRTQLVDQLREVALCRTQLTTVLTALQTSDPPTEAPGLLLPDGCRTPDEAAQRLLAGVTRDDLRELDRRVQQVLQERTGGLARACLAIADLPQTLGPLLTDLARDFLAPRLSDTSPADLFLARRIDPAVAWSAAAPALAAGTEELAAVVLPPGRVAATLGDLARQALPCAEPVLVPGATDVAFYREVPRLPLAKLPQLGPEARTAYQQYRKTEGFSPHARVDVAEWCKPG